MADLHANDTEALPAAGSRDAHVARALEVMKKEPSRRWTVASLARVSGLSRAAFARRFNKALGTSPLRWLTEHRLRLAQARLLETDLALAGVATEIGYESEFAFAKAFKRVIGIAPGLFRRRAALQRRFTVPTAIASFRAAA